MPGDFLAFSGVLLRMFGETLNAKFARLIMVMFQGFEQVDKRTGSTIVLRVSTPTSRQSPADFWTALNRPHTRLP